MCQRHNLSSVQTQKFVDVSDIFMFRFQIQIIGFNSELYNNMSHAQVSSNGIVIISLLAQVKVFTIVYVNIQGGPKIGTILLYALTSSNINRFSKLFHCQNQEKIWSLNIPPHLKCVATLPCEMSSVLEATVENKTISVTTNNTF